MRLQEVVFPAKSDEMYIRGGTVRGGTVCLKKGETLSLDTYYNCFCYTKYLRYTAVREVTFSCEISGAATLSLCVFDGGEHIVKTVSASGKSSVKFDFSELSQNGFLYVKITAKQDCLIKTAEYSAECSAREINCCIAICTYKREEYVRRNIGVLKAAKFSFINRVFVIDNGNSLCAKALSDDFIKVLPNRNLGGSGGFTRGIIEARDGGFSHVILMDDDIEFDPRTLERMTVFMSLLTPEHTDCMFSAAMFPFGAPYEQYELGGIWQKSTYLIPSKHEIDMRNPQNLLENLDNDEINYGAWWTLCMPLSVTENGLPMPFFIKFDDVEYGLRNAKRGKIITMNGVGVLHELFDLKYSPHLDYYTVRNELVTGALSNDFSAFCAFRRFVRHSLRNILYYRYDCCEFGFRAVKDFLRGVDFFLECDGEQLNRELIAIAPKMLPLSEIQGWSEELRCDDHEKRGLNFVGVITLGGHLIPSFFLDKRTAAFPIPKLAIGDVVGRRRIIQYQWKGAVGMLTERSFAKFLKCAAKTAVYSVRLLAGYCRAKHDYLTRRTEITSEVFWRGRLG